MEYKDYDKGQRLSHGWVNEVNKGIKRLRNIRGAGGVTVSTSEGGIVIRGNNKPGTQTILAKAKVEEGSYPSFDDWSSGDQPWVYQFKLGEFYWDEDFPNTQATFTEAEDFVYAYNLTRHYIPQNAIVPLSKIDGKWQCNYIMPWHVYGYLNDTLEPNGSANATLWSGQEVTGDFTVYDYFQMSSQAFTANTRFVASLRRTLGFFSTIWQYVLTEATVCPVEIEEEEGE